MIGLKNTLLFVVLLSYFNVSLCKMKSKDQMGSFLYSTIKTMGLQEKTQYYSENPEDYLAATGDITDKSCPKPNLAAPSEKICYCDKGFANFPFNGVDGVFCTYKQKSQLTSFLCELLLGMGIGHFLIGQHVMGSFKLILVILPCIIGGLGLCGVIKTKMSEGAAGMAVSILLYAMSFAWFIWWLTDAIMFGLNKYRDSNDVPLKAW